MVDGSMVGSGAPRRGRARPPEGLGAAGGPSACRGGTGGCVTAECAVSLALRRDTRDPWSRSAPLAAYAALK